MQDTVRNWTNKPGDLLRWVLFVNWMSQSGISVRRDSVVCAGCEGEGAAVVGQRHQSRRRSSWRGDGKPFEWLRRPLNPSRAVTPENHPQPVAFRSEVDQGKLMMSPAQRANWTQQMAALTAAEMERMGACCGKWRQIEQPVKHTRTLQCLANAACGVTAHHLFILYILWRI